MCVLRVCTACVCCVCVLRVCAACVCRVSMLRVCAACVHCVCALRVCAVCVLRVWLVLGSLIALYPNLNMSVFTSVTGGVTPNAVSVGLTRDLYGLFALDVFNGMQPWLNVRRPVWGEGGQTRAAATGLIRRCIPPSLLCAYHRDEQFL